MRLLDRYVLRHYVLAYVICFACLLALYVVVDLFTKLDEFAERAHGTRSILENIGIYYLYRLPWFYRRLSAILALLATMFTLGTLQRQNEILPFLSAGVSTRRLLCPILLASVASIGLAQVNQECVIPRCGEYLQRGANDPRGHRDQRIEGCYDSNLILVEGELGKAKEQMVHRARITLPAQLMGRIAHLTCEQIFYRPPDQLGGSGWWLNGVTPPALDCHHRALSWTSPGRYFLHTDLSFQRLTRNANWFYFQATPTLFRLLQQEGQLPHRTEVVALLHGRLTEPLLEFLLVLLGLPFILGPSQKNLYLKLGLCLVVYAAFQGVLYTCSHMAQHDLLDPMLAAWLPVFVFGPAVFGLLDTIRS